MPESPRRRDRFFNHLPVWFAAGSMLLAGCAQSASGTLSDSLPVSNSIGGWTTAGPAQTYDPKTLFDYINGTSEYYFTYTFEAVATNRYRRTDGSELNVEVWQFADPQDAYGLFSGRLSGSAVSIGSANEAALEPASRLVFWQNRWFINLTAVDTIPDNDLRLFAEFISKALPAGGDKPEIIGRLPVEGLIPESVKFFHQELAIQDRLWLGGENRLGLGLETDAVYAQYDIDGAEWGLLLVQYPDSAQADAGLQALASGLVENLAAADSTGTMIGAVVGQGDPALAVELLGKALGK